MSLLLDSSVAMNSQTSVTMLSGLQQVTVIPSEFNIQSNQGSSSVSVFLLANGTSTGNFAIPTGNTTQSSSKSFNGAVYNTGNQKNMLLALIFLIVSNVGLII